MRLEALAGNEALKQQLSAQQAGRGLSHAYMICGPAGTGKRTLARLMAAALVCTHPGEKPCGQCSACKKALGGIHPDIITVGPLEGKREILVDQVRQVRTDAYIRPNEAERKVYILCQAQTMNPSAQNSLLKLLEEGPAYGAFLLLTDNPGALLPTIRSRCERLTLAPVRVEEAESYLRGRFPQWAEADIARVARSCGGVLGNAVAQLSDEPRETEALAGARQLLEHLSGGDELALAEWCIGLEKWERTDLSDLLEQGVRLLRDALLLQAGAVPLTAAEDLPAVEKAARLSRGKLMGAVGLLEQLRQAALAYVGTGHICGALCAGASQLS